MGRTLQTTKQILLEEQANFKNFRRTLPKEYQPYYDLLFIYVFKNTASISMANHALPIEAALLAMLVETTREIDRLHQMMVAQNEKIERLNIMASERSKEIKRLRQLLNQACANIEAGC